MALTNLIPWKRSEKQLTVHREPQDPFYALQGRINQLFDEILGTPEGFGFRLANLADRFGEFSPQVDVIESEKAIKITAELPGMDDKDINVTFAHNTLTISGEKKENKEETDKGYYYVERSYGSFQRSIPIPTEIESDKIDATFKKGVLTITLPKTKAAQAAYKRIPVKKA